MWREIEARAPNRDDGLTAWLSVLDAGFHALELVESSDAILLIASRNAPDSTTAKPPSLRARAVTLAVSQGLSNAEVAYDLGVSEPTVKHDLAASLRWLGLRRRIDLVRLATGLAHETADEGETLRVLRITSGPVAEHPELSEAEADVLRILRRGSSNRQIAVARAVSERTIAKQVGALLRKYGAGSREELVRRSSLPPCVAREQAVA